MLVPYDNLISRVDDVFNAVMVFGDGIDRAMFYGRGAGMLPTASAVLGDVIEELKTEEIGTDRAQTWEDCNNDEIVADYRESSARMYFRVSAGQDVMPEGAEVIENGSELAFVTKTMTFAEAEKLEASIKAAGGEVKSRIAVLDI